ncbi:multidrug effflux MFS transporter [Sphingomonas crusticola]|uniref:multidrug effflux MFS transporter n=1 Tax=Sphingomonas crusticola TaxID=1697973 RepID=UPI001F0730E7|nr:multidrug effflux MFS transporter [Sphingomonas crusticola]
MPTQIDPKPASQGAGPGMAFGLFVALIASLMAVTPLGIDSMLPALPEIGRSLNIATENHQQWVIAIYVFGFGAAQIVYGPLSDSYGRKPILVVSLLLFSTMSIIAGLSQSFEALLAARLFQGIAGASGRVLTVSIVRDCFSGRQMARVMSISFMIFLAVPIMAPSIGQLIMLLGSWRLIFFFLAGFAGVVVIISGFLMHETLHPEYRRPLSARAIGQGIAQTLRERTALGYMLAMTLIFGSLMGFINSVQQIFADIFHAPKWFPAVFAGVGLSMAVSAFINSRIVERFGTRKVSHTALLGLIGVSAVHVVVAMTRHETMLSFAILQWATMFCFGLIGSNFGSMAMENVGEIAGTASSVQGFVSTCGGALLGLAIGQAFNGTVVPLALGFFLLGLAALGVVLITERGKLFRAHHAARATEPALH